MGETKTEKIEKPKKSEEGHAWVVFGPDGVVHMVERSQLRAAMAAIAVKGDIVKWPFGKTLAEVKP